MAKRKRSGGTKKSKHRGGKRHVTKRIHRKKKASKRAVRRKGGHRSWSRCHRCLLPIMGGAKGMATHNRRHHRGKK